MLVSAPPSSVLVVATGRHVAEARRRGEDVINRTTATPGFRNMGDPEQFGDPSHYSRRYTGTEDNGGVHTNSGISNHAYYLTVNGGRNASCTANASHGVLLTGKDCKVKVPRLGLAKAERIYFDGFTSLPEYANFCDARNATMAVAGSSKSSVGKAWDAVGVHRGCAPARPRRRRAPASRTPRSRSPRRTPTATTVTARTPTTTGRPASGSTSACWTPRRTTTTSTSRMPPAPRWRRTPAT